MIRRAASACRWRVRSCRRWRTGSSDSLLVLPPRIFVQFRRDDLITRRTDAVAELGVGMLGDVALDLHPVLVVVADPFAVAADRQQTAQLLHVRERRL